ncbi:hypothetical protein [Streptomyces sp. CB03238]|uniref:hypothetical protein n=1 Tax=Streptomyces sp. CB03238 TaxID=1907777 RepID=UPI000A0FB5B9|nr:hypothetical protein [Streptomyces sp. CB03238]ORT56398.1 hypothetical protein BKD26_28385 [Streptomyces sp. CB03238]
MGSSSSCLEPPQYVDEDLIEELEAKQGQTRLSPDKLLQLVRELNACFRGGHAYACHALVRAIIDLNALLRECIDRLQ